MSDVSPPPQGQSGVSDSRGAPAPRRRRRGRRKGPEGPTQDAAQGERRPPRGPKGAPPRGRAPQPTREAREASQLERTLEGSAIDASRPADLPLTEEEVAEARH